MNRLAPAIVTRADARRRSCAKQQSPCTADPEREMSHLPHIRKKTTARFSRSCRKTFRIIISSLFGPKFILILLLIEEKILLRGIVGPNIFNGLVNIALVLDFLQILIPFERSPRTCSIIDQLIFRRRPWSVFEFGCQFKCPVHNFNVFKFPNISGLAKPKTGLFRHH